MVLLRPKVFTTGPDLGPYKDFAKLGFPLKRIIVVIWGKYGNYIGGI